MHNHVEACSLDQIQRCTAIQQVCILVERIGLWPNIFLTHVVQFPHVPFHASEALRRRVVVRHDHKRRDWRAARAVTSGRVGALIDGLGLFPSAPETRLLVFALPALVSFIVATFGGGFVGGWAAVIPYCVVALQVSSGLVPVVGTVSRLQR